ncbi:class I SAM-dependent methyltransferase [Aliarcobacter cryaerophilus]|uniref:class I SAM-dependent methyltransferase n=1 Tax=Aliarcobacter cryaerophilus TaxID=28198 RepID=UPI0021B2C291|nr:class I SAM-dependent methyltransferase [Aliarcobacter cryaerophilus]MCT7464890.1 class I SAM-dependent methyltransferase [Aliarcobacter cryaerophilus]
MKNTLNYYEINYKNLSIKYENADVNEIQNILFKTFEKKSKLLEIGCGSGRDASFMTSNGFDVIGIDGSKNMIDEAKKNHPKLSTKLFNKTLPNDLTFDTKFDGIYSIATLMHLTKDDLKKTILKIYDLLNPSGKILISVSLFRDDLDEHGFDKDGRYFLILNFEEWISIFKNIGFNILEIKTNKDGLNRTGIEWLTVVAQK